VIRDWLSLSVAAQVRHVHGDGGGRELASDNTEFLRIRLPVSLIPDERDERDDHDRDRDDD
jgi:hypothetical protein